MKTTALKAAGTARAAEATEQIVDEVVEIAVAPEVDIHAGNTTARTTGLVPVLTELLVFATFIRIGENLIGLADLLEPGFGSLIAGIDIRVVLPSQLAKGSFDRIGVGTSVHAQHLEVVLVSAASHGINCVKPLSQW